jgi:PAS domain-containing protein
MLKGAYKMCAHPNLVTYEEEPLRFERLLTDPPMPFKGLAAGQIDGTNEATQRPLRDILELDHYELLQWDDTSIADVFANSVARNRFVDALVKSQERRVFEADERFRLVIESFPTAVVLVDNEGEIVLLNSRTTATFGYKREELFGRRSKCLFRNVLENFTA